MKGIIKKMKNKEKYIGIFGILLVTVIFFFIGYINDSSDKEIKSQIVSNDSEKSIFVDNTAEKNNEKEKFIVVDIKGAVKNPKEYTLKEGSRVRDLINEAGGILQDADENQVYYSQVLEDQQCVYIYKKGEVKEEEAQAVPGNESSVNKDGKINLNTATLEQLKTINGIGNVKAQAIINYRTSIGKFKAVDELANIDGFGSKTVEKIKNSVYVK